MRKPQCGGRGKRTDLKGKTLVEWMAGRDMHLQNDEYVSTCLRWNGQSVVGLVWATPERDGNMQSHAGNRNFERP